MIKRKIIILVGFLSLLFLLDCSRDYPIFEEKNVKFPLSVGNSWTLKREFKIVFHPPVSPWGDSLVWHDSIYSKIIDRDILQGHESYILQNDYYEEDRSHFFSLEWYTDSWDGCPGLYEIGHTRGGPPKALPGYKFRFAGREFNSPYEISLWIQGLRPCKGDTITRISPRKVLMYPLYIGKEWVAFNEPSVCLQTRKVVDKELVTTPAGDFSCYKIEVVNEYTLVKNSIIWYDWFSNKGLVKSYSWSISELVDENNNKVGTCEITDVYLLEDYCIH
jgi:hypothetical protein